MPETFAAYLAPTPMIDSDHPAVAAYARELAAGAAGAAQAAVRLFYAVRDDLRYDPYGVRIDTDSLRASRALAARRGWCVSKAALLVACCRSIGIPARMGFADVRNHLSTARMRETMKTDVFYWHGYASIRLAERWVKATPAFNRELCDKFELLPLEWDGQRDSLYHTFDREGRQHMEYVRERGEFADIPLDRMRETWEREYAQLAASWSEGDFDAEVDAETRGGTGGDSG